MKFTSIEWWFSLFFSLKTRPADGIYWKRYGPTSFRRKFHLDQIKIIARQILQSLQFVHENHLIYAHLHSGNLLIDCESSPVVQLLDICNVVAGVSSKFRSHYVTLKSSNVNRRMNGIAKWFRFSSVFRRSKNQTFMRLPVFYTNYQRVKNVQAILDQLCL